MIEVDINLRGCTRRASLFGAVKLLNVTPRKEERERVPRQEERETRNISSTSSRNCQEFRHMTLRADPLDCATEQSRDGFSERLGAPRRASLFGAVKLLNVTPRKEERERVPRKEERETVSG